MTPQEKLRRLAHEATPGPWSVFQQDSSCVYLTQPGSPWFAIAETVGKEDARLIALSPELAVWAADVADFFDQNVMHAYSPSALLARLAEITGAET